MSFEKHSIMAIVLAAGKGSRMKSENPKVLSLLRGKPLIDYIIESLFEVSVIQKIVLVVGYRKELVMQHCSKYNVEYSYQEKQRGTADALLAAKEKIKGFGGSVLVTCGDMPLISYQSFQRIIEFHSGNNVDMTILSAHFENPIGYGRIVRGESGRVEAIVEDKDATELQKKITEINTGSYLFKTNQLFSCLSEVHSKNKQNEYYLTDLAQIYYEKKMNVDAVCLRDRNESLGINSEKDLLYAEEILGT